MKKLFGMMLALVLAVTICSCGTAKNDEEATGTPPVLPGSPTTPETSGSVQGTALKGLADCTVVPSASVICGKVTAADGITPIAGALITIDDPSSLTKSLKSFNKAVQSDSECTTDELGEFACQVPFINGNYTFYITSILGSSSFTSTLTAGTLTNVALTSTKIQGTDSDISKWAVVTGSFDSIEVLLGQMKGCADPLDCTDKGLYVYNPSDEEQMTELITNLDTFGAVFDNCGSSLMYYLTDGQKQTLANYVINGGNVYFSDWEEEALVELFPGKVNIAGQDTWHDTLTGATLVDTGLTAYMGKSTIDIYFDLDIWYAIDTVVDTDVTTYIKADISPMSDYTGVHPITVGFKYNEGCVFYTSYHVEADDGGNDLTEQENVLKYLVLNKMNNCQ